MIFTFTYVHSYTLQYITHCNCLITLHRDLDYNPNKPSTIVTCSDDRKIKFWDVRNLTKGKERFNLLFYQYIFTIFFYEIIYDAMFL